MNAKCVCVWNGQQDEAPDKSLVQNISFKNKWRKAPSHITSHEMNVQFYSFVRVPPVKSKRSSNMFSLVNGCTTVSDKIFLRVLQAQSVYPTAPAALVNLYMLTSDITCYCMLYSVSSRVMCRTLLLIMPGVWFSI